MDDDTSPQTLVDIPAFLPGASGAEQARRTFLGGSVIQVSGTATQPQVTVVEAATVTVTDQRVLARAANSEWSWYFDDLDEVIYGRDASWTVLAVPGVPDHGVLVSAADVDEFRRTIDDERVVAMLDPDVRQGPRPNTAPVVDLSVPMQPVARSEPAPAPPPSRPGPSSALAGLEADQISAWFGSHHVLDRVSLEMSAGEVTALIGPSGCGKSTFLRILNRMHEMIPSAAMAGEVRLDGADIYDPDRRLTDARREIGMVFQKPNPFPAMSIYDNVVASFRLTGLKSDQAVRDETVESCLRKAGLWNEVKDRLRQPGGGLSGGQQQRLCIARALAIKPRVLLMDEPCSALDPTSTRRIEQTIQELADEVTIVIVTHNMQQAARVSHRCAFFLAEQSTPGVIVEHGPTEAMFSNPQDPRTSDYVNGRFG